MATARCSPPPVARPAGATGRSAGEASAAQLEQPDQRLRVLGLVDDRVELGERADLDVDALVLLRLRRRVGEPGREVDVADLVGEARRGEERVQVLPLRGGLADLLRELALGGRQRLLALDVELAGGQLEQVGPADRLARLAHEPERLAVVADHPDRALVADDLARRLLAVLVAERLLANAEDLALVLRLGADGLELGAHTAAASSSSAKATSSIPSSAATATRSVGSWLRSVPLARFTHVKPPASSTFASDPPPVTIRFGS